MKARTEQEQQEKLFRIVTSKWKRKVVRIEAVKQITDECLLIAIAINRKLCPLLRAMAQVAVKDKDLANSIKSFNDYNSRRLFLKHQKRMKEEWFYRFRNHFEGTAFSVQYFFYKLFHRIDEV